MTDHQTPSDQAGSGQTRRVADAAAKGATRLSTAGAALLCVVLYFLLIDAAVETSLAGASVRWIVVGTVAAYLAVTVLLRRKLTVGASAWASVLVLLGLLALTAWWPEGMITGVVVLRQPTSTVLAAVTALAIVFAGSVLVRLTWIPTVGKAVLGLLALYGVVSLAWGIVAPTPYPDLFRGLGFWTRLPFWIQGALVGALTSLPAVVLLQLHRVLTPGLPGARRSHSVRMIASGLSLIVVAAGVFGPDGSTDVGVWSSNRSPAGGLGPKEAGGRGPGLGLLDTVASLTLPVPRAFDLSHVDPTYFADALGNDPLRIFEFVRNQIAYEAYEGCLRGPQGTLMAMAGNSVDRSALLASLFERSGQRVRYARGRLSEESARELIASIWTERRRNAPTQQQLNASAKMKTAAAVFLQAVKRDYSTLRDQLQKTESPAKSESASELSFALKSAEDHYWLQWWREGTWVDLDPAFADARPGQTYAKLESILDTLPDSVFHRVDIRVRLEEYADGSLSTREILRYSATAAGVSGSDILLTHQPQDWGGGFENLQAALLSPVETTGLIKPVLLVPALPPVLGDSFRQKQPDGGGIADVGSLLAGEEAPKVPIATAEFIEFTFSDPAGSSETIVREIFDLLGHARRARAEALTEEDINGLLRDELSDITASIYDMFFTTGAIDVVHLVNLTPAKPSALVEGEALNVSATLSRLNISFTALSDALMARVTTSNGLVCRFYPASPRVQIAELWTREGTIGLGLDLRRNSERGIEDPANPKALFFARVLRGVVDGTLERVLLDYISGPATDAGPSGTPSLSTSLVFERAQADGVPLVLRTRAEESPSFEVPEGTRLRLDRAFARGQLVLGPIRPVSLGVGPRFAWWEIDPRSGETVAVTDEGLHGTSIEYKIIINKKAQTGIIWIFAGGRYHSQIAGGLREIENLAERIHASGVFKVFSMSWESW